MAFPAVAQAEGHDFFYTPNPPNSWTQPESHPNLTASKAAHLTETSLNLIICNVKGNDAPYLQKLFNFLQVDGSVSSFSNRKVLMFHCLIERS